VNLTSRQICESFYGIWWKHVSINLGQKNCYNIFIRRPAYLSARIVQATSQIFIQAERILKRKGALNLLSVVVFFPRDNWNRTERSFYKTNRHISSNTTTPLYSKMSTYFDLKRPSSGSHYKYFKTRHHSVQIMIVVWSPI
jgi:hypothetical protein